ETPPLFFPGDREPVLVKPDAGPYEHPLELGRLPHEFEVLARGAEAHHPLHPGAVVPAAVVEDHFTRRRQMGDVALEEPLALLDVRGLGQRADTGVARIQMLHEALDRAALAGRI